jgi:cytochrome c556
VDGKLDAQKIKGGQDHESKKAGNDADLGVKVKALGDACGSCHKAFRAEKYAE